MSVILDCAGMDALLQELIDRGFRPVGPTVRDGAIVYDDLAAMSDLPLGWTDEQHAGVYRLHHLHDERWFGYVVGPHSWKQFVHPPSEVIWSGSDGPAAGVLEQSDRFAFIGVRPCELAALDRLDGALLGDFADEAYRGRRQTAFIVAVNCLDPGGTCFCASMGTGPAVEGGFDISLTELIDDQRHVFVATSGSEQGEQLLAAVTTVPANATDLERERTLIARAAQRMGRRLDTSDIGELLSRNRLSDRWEEIASRCLGCANCTMVCPTCFCVDVADTLTLDGTAVRSKTWGSCFSIDFSYIHGGPIRTSPAARYRHWITHKLATWIDQFGTSGCVGCGRCITWCPAAIDITEEIAALRKEEHYAYT